MAEEGCLVNIIRMFNNVSIATINNSSKRRKLSKSALKVTDLINCQLLSNFSTRKIFLNY